MRIKKIKHFISPILITSFTIWLLCILIFIATIFYIDHTPPTSDSKNLIILLTPVFLGTLSFGIGLIAITYKIKRKNVKKSNTILAIVKVLFLLGILPLFLLWNILQPIRFIAKIKSLGISGCWKEFRGKIFALKLVATFVVFFIILPMWIIGYCSIFFIAEKTTKKNFNLAEQTTDIDSFNSETKGSKQIKEDAKKIIYDESVIKSWENTLNELIQIQPSWQEWNKDSDSYKNNKNEIERINSIISQRISNCRKILVSMKSEKPLTREEQELIEIDSSLYDEQESLAYDINNKVEKFIKELKKETKELKEETAKIQNKTYETEEINTYVPVPPAYVSPYKNQEIESSAKTELEEETCENLYKTCVESGIRNEENLLRARGMSNSSEAELIESKVTKNCKKQYKCSYYP